MATISIRSPSRLHFGLLSVHSADVGGRRFGGVGLMIDRPGVRLSLQPAPAWTATGPCAERALEFAKHFIATVPSERRLGALHVQVEQCPAEHVGLGVGTQLALAVARGLALMTGLEHEDAAALARRVGRGARSSLGIHGFQHGGLLVEGGKTPDTAIAPLVARQPFPEAWQVLLVQPRGLCGAHGTREVEAFASLTPSDRDHARTEALCRLTLLGILPALLERDLPAFGEALHEFNRKAGEWFQVWQEGVYSHPRVAELVDAIRGQGTAGAGQSSWGPTVFAIDAPERLLAVVRTLVDRGAFADDEWSVSPACNLAQKSRGGSA
jgi:beta-RFAP synthase